MGRACGDGLRCRDVGCHPPRPVPHRAAAPVRRLPRRPRAGRRRRAVPGRRPASEYDDVVAAARRHADRLLADTDLAGPMRRLELEEAQDARISRLAAVHRRHEAELERVAEHARLTARRVRHAAASVLPGGATGGGPVRDDEALLAGRLPLAGGGASGGGSRLHATARRIGARAGAGLVGSADTGRAAAGDRSPPLPGRIARRAPRCRTHAGQRAAAGHRPRGAAGQERPLRRRAAVAAQQRAGPAAARPGAVRRGPLHPRPAHRPAARLRPDGVRLRGPRGGRRR